MKEWTKSVSLLTLSFILFTGCYGKFQATRKLYQWNGAIGDKFTNSVVMWAMMIVPVYPVAGFLDLFVLNTMEFWTGSNPLTMGEDESEAQIVERDGIKYELKASKNRMEIRALDAAPDVGQVVAIQYNPKDQSWYLEADGQIKKIIEENEELEFYDLEGRLLSAIPHP